MTSETHLFHLVRPNRWVVDPSGCWLWSGPLEQGYGHVSTRRGGKSVSAGVHRVALAKHLGRDLRPGMFACHTCDVPSCVNPEHLYEGTPKQNTQDMIRRGRRNDSHLKGGLATRALSYEQALNIRARAAEGAVQADLMREYGVSADTISGIVQGLDYGFTTDCRPDDPSLRRSTKRGLTREQVTEILKRTENESQRSIETNLGLSSGTVSRIKSGKIYSLWTGLPTQPIAA